MNGRFVCGLDFLRDKLEQQKAQELSLQKEKKTLVLYLSHDIKTPLSVIELYAKPLEKDLYRGEEKKKEMQARCANSFLRDLFSVSLINISFSQEKDCIIISVSNTGSKLTQNELTHIFDSFRRGSNVGSNRGSGLGLYICRSLMHKMDGEIFAEYNNGTMTESAVFGMA